MMSTNTPLITTHSTAQGIVGDSDSVPTGRPREEEDKCRNTTKILAFATFLIALSVGGYFTADLLANKGKSVKVESASNKQDTIIDIMDYGVDYWSTDLSQDIRPHAFYYGQSYPKPKPYDFNQPQQGGQGQPPPQGGQGQSGQPGQSGQAGNDGFSSMKVTNCDQDHDQSDDKETYQTDIRSVANYLKTYWESYEQFIVSDIQQFTNGGLIDLECLQKKFESGEVVCRDQTCVYDGDCIWKTEWDSVGICKYFYFEIGGLTHEQRPDRRACIAAMLVEQWSNSCWTYEGVPDEMKSATFNWWKQIFTVSDDFELEDCPC